MLGNSKIDWKGHKTIHDNPSDGQKWQFALQLPLHQDFSSWLCSCRHCPGRRTWTPTRLSSCAPSKSKSGALTGWVKVTGHTLGVRGEGGLGNKYSIYSAPCSLGSQPRLRNWGILQTYKGCQIHLFYMTDVLYRQWCRKQRNPSYNISSVWDHLCKWKQPGHKT